MSTTNRRELSHERILDAASRAVRRQGYAGVGVADVMKEAGLTHGGFYAHFKSRDALLAAAVEHAGAQSGKAIAARIASLQEGGASPLRAFVEAYLADEHLAAADLGCPVAALASDMPRQPDEVWQASRQRVEALIAFARKCLPSGNAKEAFALVSAMVGAVQLARALGDQARPLLKATAAALVKQYDHSS
ncbi:TetR/AcrR family transcriptional regulator [Massilia endophytica]|uniref:TetR/AcrR family transcriptional regulator n=1 Tax=Massilia endophytica TaxID=2899220 RepID=UPI001E36BCAF|nr:TetR/AcrR family transcriptional regulator [Massilia endophytica]UGQ48166.1 TetR/AcrR family transcriptional regulator [Massilia endophytica]